MALARTGDITRTLKVRGLPPQRVGAPAAAQFVDDLTPPEEYQKRKERPLEPLFYRLKGLGRPTKKDRREIGKIRKLF